MDGEKKEVILTEQEKGTLQKSFTCFLKHTENIYVIDIDMPSISSMDDFINQTEFKQCPYIKGNTKGIHIYVKMDNVPEYSNQQGVYNDFDGDFLKLNNVWGKNQ